jgi:hypothetical protein
MRDITLLSADETLAFLYKGNLLLLSQLRGLRLRDVTSARSVSLIHTVTAVRDVIPVCISSSLLLGNQAGSLLALPHEGLKRSVLVIYVYHHLVLHQARDLLVEILLT